MRKLLYTLLLATTLFLASFATGFFTIGRAMAQPEAGGEAPPPGGEAGATTGVDPHVASPTAPDPHAGAQHHDPSKDFRFFGSPFGHGAKDVKGGKYGDGVMTDEHGNTVPEEPMSAPFIYMVLNFALLLFILMKFGGPAAKKSAAERHDQIKTALDEAAKLRQEAADKLAQFESRLKDADSEIKKLVDGMRADAEADKARILENAARQAALMKRDAEARIAAEIEYARAALTKEVTAAAAKATEDLLKKKMVAGDQQKLVTTFISDITAQKEAR